MAMTNWKLVSTKLRQDKLLSELLPKYKSFRDHEGYKQESASEVGDSGDGKQCTGSESAIVIKLKSLSFHAQGNCLLSEVWSESRTTSSYSLLDLVSSSHSFLETWLLKDSTFSQWVADRKLPRSQRNLHDQGTVGELVHLYIRGSNAPKVTEPVLTELDDQVLELERRELHERRRSSSGTFEDDDQLLRLYGVNKLSLLSQLNPDSCSLFEILTNENRYTIFSNESSSSSSSTDVHKTFSDSSYDDPTRKVDSPKRAVPASAGDDLRKLQNELKKAQAEISSLKTENSQLKDEGVRLRKVAMTDTVMSTPSSPTPTSITSVRAFPPVVYIVAAIILGLIIGKFLL